MLEEALETLRLGGVVAYPTETVWGLGVDATNEEAIRQLFALKGRDFSSAISILVRDIEMAGACAEISAAVDRLLAVVWPGPVTVVLPRKKVISDMLTAGSEFIGLRCSSNKVVSELVCGFSKPITTTSANRSGSLSPTKKRELEWLPETVYKYGSDGPELKSRKGSTVIKINRNDEYEILREGDFPIEVLKRVLYSFNLSPYQLPQP